MNIEQEIQEIQLRNRRVELDKAWENSWTRKISITITMYAFMIIMMFSLDLPSPFINAIIPTSGFILSTLGLSFVKTAWIKCRKVTINVKQ